MILVDTSVWIDHLKTGDPGLAALLESGRVLAHPFVTGEIALSSLRQRSVVLGALRDLPQAVVASDDEVMTFIESQALYAIGIGYVDAHLLTAAQLTPGVMIWIRDRRLREASIQLQLSANLARQPRAVAPPGPDVPRSPGSVSRPRTNRPSPKQQVRGSS